MAKQFGENQVGVASLGEYICLGETITLVVESDTGGGFIAKVSCFTGLRIRVERTATAINFEWKNRHSSRWYPFPDGEGVYTIASTVASDIWCMDE